MAGRRVGRVARAIQQAVSEIVVLELKDPRAGFVTITRVEPTPDLREAKVYFSVMGEEAEQRRVAQCLRHARGFIQREVAERLPMRFCPHLILTEDVGYKMSLEVTRLLAETRRERSLDAESTTEDESLASGPEAT
jgi:ribosome-binding factor A